MGNWTEHIKVDPAVCHGKACIRGTRVTISVILDNVAVGVSPSEILASYPALTSEDIDAALRYGAELVRDGSIDLPTESCRPASHPRITIEPDKRGGKPCIRRMRITVSDVLGWRAHGMTEEDMLDEHPDLEKQDFAAVCAFAAEMAAMAYGDR